MEQHGASTACIGSPIPRPVCRVQTLGPQGTPGCQTGTSPNGTQDRRLVADDRGRFPAVRETTSTCGGGALEGSRSASMGLRRGGRLVALGVLLGKADRSRDGHASPPGGEMHGGGKRSREFCAQCQKRDAIDSTGCIGCSENGDRMTPFSETRISSASSSGKEPHATARRGAASRACS